MTVRTVPDPVSDQPYHYRRAALVEPDWRRFPGWRDVTEADWASAQWQRAPRRRGRARAATTAPQPDGRGAPRAAGRPGRPAGPRRGGAAPARARHAAPPRPPPGPQPDAAPLGPGPRRTPDRRFLR